MATQIQPSAAKRPRLSLQTTTTTTTTATPTINTASKPPQRPRFAVNPSDPTAFNTLSNVYTTVIERSTPVTAVNTLHGLSLKIPTNIGGKVGTPFVSAGPETPLSAYALSPATTNMRYPSIMTPTPPMSAGPVDPSSPRVFVFSAITTSETKIRRPATGLNPYSPLIDAAASLRRFPATTTHLSLPYSHPRSLHSILRNSPLPPRTASPISPRRQSQRLQERASRRVCYHSPLEQEITTNRYIRSHIDLLLDDASPSPLSPFSGTRHTFNKLKTKDTEDGGQTPGPMEDAARKLAKLVASSPMSPAGKGGPRKRKRFEKKRHWVWTIGQGCEDEDEDEVGGAIAALRAQAAAAAAGTARHGHGNGPLQRLNVPEATLPETPTSSIESSGGSSCGDSIDTDMSDVDSLAPSETNTTASSVGPEDRFLALGDIGADMKTPVGPVKHLYARLTAHEGPREDSPIPEQASC